MGLLYDSYKMSDNAELLHFCFSVWPVYVSVCCLEDKLEGISASEQFSEKTVIWLWHKLLYVVVRCEKTKLSLCFSTQNLIWSDQV